MNYCHDLLTNCKQAGHQRLAIELDTGFEVTYDDLLSRVRRAVTFLMRHGVGPGASVAIHLYNSIDAIVVHMAIQWLGARSCFVDALVQPKALAYYTDITSATLLVTHCALTELAPEVWQRTQVVISHDFSQALREAEVNDVPEPYSWDLDEVCYVYFTSGTTNEPKGVMLSRGNHENFTRICDHYWQPVTQASKHICFVPFSHGFGTIFLVPLAIRTRSELYILRAFNPVKVLGAIDRYDITHIYGVPSHYQQLLRLPNTTQTLSKLQMAFCAAAKLEHALMLQWQKATGTILCEGYGLIETCCGTTWRVGTPSLGTGHMGPCPEPSLMEFGIFDENDQLVAPGRVGQIVVRGPSVMKGYLKRESATAEVMRGDWFLSGDEGYITPDGELFMTGRIKDIINIAGIKVSPYEVEAVLLQHPTVAEVAVVASADSLYGEVVKAYVRTKPGIEADERDLLRFAAQHLMNFQVPKRVEFLDTMPVNNMGKLDRKKLRLLNPI